MIAVLIVFFRLFLVSVEPNEGKHLTLQKPRHLLSALNFYTLFKGINCNHDYSAFKKYTVYRGFCCNKER